MLNAWLIEQIRKQERERQQEQPQIQIEEPYPVEPNEELKEEQEPRGVIEIAY